MGETGIMRQSPKESVIQLLQTEWTSGAREASALHATDIRPAGTGALSAIEHAVPSPWAWKPER